MTSSFRFFKTKFHFLDQIWAKKLFLPKVFGLKEEKNNKKKFLYLIIGSKKETRNIGEKQKKETEKEKKAGDREKEHKNMKSKINACINVCLAVTPFNLGT